MYFVPVLCRYHNNSFLWVVAVSLLINCAVWNEIVKNKTSYSCPEDLRHFETEEQSWLPTQGRAWEKKCLDSALHIHLNFVVSKETGQAGPWVHTAARLDSVFSVFRNNTLVKFYLTLSFPLPCNESVFPFVWWRVSWFSGICFPSLQWINTYTFVGLHVCF